MSLQTHINRYFPMGIEGDFASTNPFFTEGSPLDGGLVAASPAGVVAGRFAWIDEEKGTVSTSLVPSSSGQVASPAGFVGRQGHFSALIGGGEGSLQLAPGSGVTVYTAGDFWLRLAASSIAAVRGGRVYALLATGEAVAGSADSTPEGSVGTEFRFVSSAQPGTLVRVRSFGGSV
ncbi:structural cement protein Gp24 [Entomobacter blattae]|uniref:Uncharacterized protein n=1 Tax=Entomobacter blattae TaxID=2762277 RepID=A0A7H1NR62_9PROT|nr:hypothetical protein [Entomobacter blattae]QNT78272.1 hypothetical protein JGUZn3_10440 [Entomobacter blattae]